MNEKTLLKFSLKDPTRIIPLDSDKEITWAEEFNESITQKKASNSLSIE